MRLGFSGPIDVGAVVLFVAFGAAAALANHDGTLDTSLTRRWGPVRFSESPG